MMVMGIKNARLDNLSNQFVQSYAMCPAFTVSPACFEPCSCHVTFQSMFLVVGGGRHYGFSGDCPRLSGSFQLPLLSKGNSVLHNPHIEQHLCCRA